MTTNRWTPLALARDIAPGAAAGAVLQGAEIVLWRAADGRIHAWEDRCPHRGMKLSFGFVKGDRIACLYHGWEYDGGARCRYIPAHPDLKVPASIRATAHAAAEASGMVWVDPTATAAAPPDPPPDESTTPLRSLWIDAPLANVVAALGAGLPGLGPAALAGAPPLLRLAQGGHTILAGLHAPGPDCAAVHIAVAGEAAPATLDRFARAAEAFRRAVEAEAHAA